MEVLSSAAAPLNEISEYGKRPKLPDQNEFLELVNGLKQKGHISSFKRSGEGTLQVFTRYNSPS